jgi:ATP synthase F1 delta subunit
MASLSTKTVAQAIYESTKGKSGEELERALTNAKDFLIKKNLLSKFPEILENLQKLVDDDEGAVRASIISAKKLPDTVAKEVGQALKKRYNAKKILITLKENSSLKGGMRIEAKDEVIDLSLKHKLNQLEAHLLHN